jgi:hypothetical protein
VLGHEVCLGQMPRNERRVLALRAGLGIGRTRSRAEVERLTGLSRKRVVAIERRGIKRLRALTQTGACGNAAAAAGTGVEAAGGGMRRGSDGAAPPQIAVLGQRDSNGAATPPPPPSGSPDSGRTLLHAPDSAVDLAPALLFVLLAGLVFALVRESRRSA